ncbi:MAG TPA: glycosyltransferase family A protein [bacterium]|nr:glycosyltransferase family A protein [bacterium]HOL48627.1 glycosyltransferase family A protein [bacterium]HPQ20077.1 glycosyltransferase family A protein [bacterium]
MIITLIIPTYNRPNDLRRCLISVVKASRKPDEIIIVDDNGKYDLNDIVKEILENKIIYKIIKNKRNVGVSNCRNIGIENSNGDLIFFLDDDCEVLPNYFEEIEKIYLEDKEKKIGGVEGIIIYEKKQISNLEKFISKIFFLTKEGESGDLQLSGFPIDCNVIDRIVETKILMGVASFRREIYKEFKYNTEFFGWCFDDCEFSYRVSKKYILIRNPNAKMYHYCSPISRESNFVNYAKRCWMHYIFWRNCVPLSLKSVLCFIWGDIGYIIWILLFNCRLRRLLGWIYGHFLIIQYIFFHKKIKELKIFNK